MDRYSELILDTRSQRDLCQEIAALAASYTPEWRFDTEHPDIGSTIALIFAGQMQDNLRRLNQVFGKYHTEFVNMLGISLLPAHPAGGVAVFSLLPDTVASLPLPKGTKLLGQALQDGEEPAVFETVNDICLTSARLTDILSISSYFGKIIPLLGGPKRVEILPAPQPQQAEPDQAAPSPPISLFDFTLPGVERNAMILYHQTVFDTGPESRLQIRLTGASGQSLAGRLADPSRYCWSYRSGEEMRPFDCVRVQEGDLVLEKTEESEAVSLDGDAYDLICLEALDMAGGPITLSQIALASACERALPAFLCHNDQDLEPERFLPFGDTASVFDECYIGHDRIFRQSGALVTLRFSLSFQERLVASVPRRQKDALTVVKRKPQAVAFEAAASAPQAVAFDYFNGLGWRRLPTTRDWSGLFDGTCPGEISLSFRCPGDWLPTVVGGYQQRCIRIRIVQADNCYLQPCIHTMPIIEGLVLSYRYDQAWQPPHLIQAVQGTRILDLTQPLHAGTPVTLFQPLPYPGNALYLGFDQRPAGAPVGLLFDVAGPAPFQSAPISFEYSSYSGWKPLKTVDNTQNMSCAGTVLFLPPPDMAPAAVEGISRFWLRLADAENHYVDQQRRHPLIRSIVPNAVEIRNVETLDAEPFYLTAPGPNMTFPLAAGNILSAEVFVNERDRLPVPVMQRMLREQPENVRAEYGLFGDISAFFVRWTEVENFDSSGPGDRHYVIDRMNHTISFGDGVHVRIPTEREGVAFTVRAVCCKGSKGNLPKGAIHTVRGRTLYLESVSNPIATCAGSDRESLESALRRGANLISGRGRLVSQMDLIREVRSFSSAIDKVKCAAGMDLYGRSNPALVTAAVMMRDYASGSYSFHSLKDQLRRRLLERLDGTIHPSCLVLAEPVYVSISLTVWAEADDARRCFALQTMIQEEIDRFLDPLGRGGAGGWDIGVLPTESQLGMLLHALRGPGRVSHFLAAARYVDQTGAHERSLDEMPRAPFAIGVPGTHRIYVDPPGQPRTSRLWR